MRETGKNPAILCLYPILDTTLSVIKFHALWSLNLLVYKLLEFFTDLLRTEIILSKGNWDSKSKWLSKIIQNVSDYERTPPILNSESKIFPTKTISQDGTVGEENFWFARLDLAKINKKNLNWHTGSINLHIWGKVLLCATQCPEGQTLCGSPAASPLSQSSCRIPEIEECWALVPWTAQYVGQGREILSAF